MLNVDERIKLENERHEIEVDRLRNLLKMYQESRNSSYIDRNVNQAYAAGIDADTISSYEESRRNLETIDPYASQIQGIKDELDKEIALHKKNMEELETLKNQQSASVSSFNGNFSSLSAEDKQKIRGYIETKLKKDIAGIDNVALDGEYFTVEAKDKEGNFIGTEIKISEFFTILKEPLVSKPIEEKLNDKPIKEDEAEKEEKNEETKEEDIKNREQLINEILKKMYPDGADYVPIIDVKRRLDTMSTEQLESMLYGYEEQEKIGANENREQLIMDIIKEMYPDGVEYVPITDIKKSLDSKTTEELKQLKEQYQSQSKKETPEQLDSNAEENDTFDEMESEPLKKPKGL